MKKSREDEWAEARRRCRLSAEAFAMAKELGLSPRSLLKNIPHPSERWKAPVEEWVRSLHERRFGRRPRAAVAAPLVPAPAATAAAAAPVRRELSPEVVNEFNAAQDALLEQARKDDWAPGWLTERMAALERDAPVSGGESDEENRRLLQRRDNFRRFGGLFAPLAARLDFVQRIVLFGSVAAPLQKEIPRFRRFRHARVELWHECKDVDLALWLTDFTRLRELKRALSDATNQWQAIAAVENLGGIPHHQADLFLLEAGTGHYRGNLCIFGQCPKGKPECEVTGCGAQPFLRRYADFPFDPRASLAEHTVILFERFSRDAKT